MTGELIGIEARGAHASNPAKHGAASSGERARKIKGRPPARRPRGFAYTIAVAVVDDHLERSPGLEQNFWSSCCTMGEFEFPRIMSGEQAFFLKVAAPP